MTSSFFNSSKFKASSSVPAPMGAGCPCWEVVEKNRFYTVKIVFLQHTLEKNGANHSAPSDQTDFHR